MSYHGLLHICFQFNLDGPRTASIKYCQVANETNRLSCYCYCREWYVEIMEAGVQVITSKLRLSTAEKQKGTAQPLNVVAHASRT